MKLNALLVFVRPAHCAYVYLDPDPLSQWTPSGLDVQLINNSWRIIVLMSSNRKVFNSSAQRLRRCCRLELLTFLKLNELNSMLYTDNPLMPTLHLLHFDSRNVLILRNFPNTAEI
jgi:hypothetical protein